VKSRVLIIVRNDERAHAEATAALMGDEPRRARLGKLGRARVEQDLAWSHQERAYLGSYRQADGQKQLDIMTDRIAPRGRATARTKASGPSLRPSPKPA
jgi:hypothetical protein